MLRELKGIERSPDALYLRFSHMPIAKTQSYLDGAVAVDIDHYNEVVGIELLGLGPEELAALSQVASHFKLSFDAWVHQAA